MIRSHWDIQSVAHNNSSVLLQTVLDLIARQAIAAVDVFRLAMHRSHCIASLVLVMESVSADGPVNLGFARVGLSCG